MTLTMALLLAAVDNLSVFDPVSRPAVYIRDLFSLVLAITGAIFVVVEGVLLYCIFRFRRTDTADTTEPPQMYGSKPIEVAWTVAPLLVVFVLFLVVFRTLLQVHDIGPGPDALEVTVIGHQWWWEYEYRRWNDQELKVRVANELHVPDNVPVHLRLESVDVIHSFWVPRLAGKTDVIPGRSNRMWFQADESGVFLGQCAEYCGAQHANMMLRVVAEPRADFEKWLENQGQPAREVAGVREGKNLFLATSCVNCHAVRGTLATGTFGPDLTHFMSRQTLAAGMVDNDRKQLTQWVDDPHKIKPGCLMPSFHLSQREVGLVVDYLRSLD